MAALLNQAVHGFVKERQVALEAAGKGRGQTVQQGAQAAGLVAARGHIVVAHLKSGANAPHGIGQLQVKQRFDDDVQGKVAQLGHQVQAGAVPPALLVAPGIVGHNFSVALNAAAVKLGLHQPPLPEMQGAVGSNQTLAQQVLQGFGVAPAPHLLVVVDEYLAHQIGMVEQIDQGRLDGHRSQIPVGGGFPHNADGVKDIAKRPAHQGQLFGAGRQGTPVHGRGRRVQGSGGH